MNLIQKHISDIYLIYLIFFVFSLFKGLPISESFEKNKNYDIISTPWLKRSFDKYIGDTNLSPHCPLISPIYEKKLNGLPKILAFSGEFEVYLDDVKQFIENARAQSVNTEFI